MQHARRDDIYAADVVFRTRADFGKDIGQWPDDIRAAFRRALGNLRAVNPHLGEIIDGEIEVINKPSLAAVGFPYVVHVVCVFRIATRH